jgi:hypothetical protein
MLSSVFSVFSVVKLFNCSKKFLAAVLSRTGTAAELFEYSA